jgi:ADP-ribosylglycohydrolase
LVNAGDPEGAYREAADLAGAHQSSYGREAAAVLAAAVAEAARPGATVDSVVETCLRLAKDGTRSAIEAVAEAARTVSGWRGAIPVLRDAFRPYDSLGEDYSEPPLGARVPSRLQTIEELPVALGFFVATDADYEGTVLGGVNYGRDSDSIASMGGALVGALRGTAALRRDWVEQVGEASRYDLEAPGDVLAQVAVEILAKDAARHEARVRAMRELAGEEVVTA